jgi:archaellum component FlaC
MEGCDMAGMTDPYVEQLDAEYRMLKVELEREVNKFELLRKQYNMRTRQLTDDITRKWFEVQRAKQESRA